MKVLQELARLWLMVNDNSFSRSRLLIFARDT